MGKGNMSNVCGRDKFPFQQVNLILLLLVLQWIVLLRTYYKLNI